MKNAVQLNSLLLLVDASPSSAQLAQGCQLYVRQVPNCVTFCGYPPTISELCAHTMAAAFADNSHTLRASTPRQPQHASKHQAYAWHLLAH